jgi:hypothetical protein
MPEIIENLSKQPTVCIVLSVIIFLFSFSTNYLLLDSLLKMHRSKSAVKKIKKEYTFLQRMRLLHFKENCCHAIKFCNRMIIYQKIAWVCLALYLIISLFFVFGLFSAKFITWLTIGIFMLFDVPTFVINRLLAKPILFGRFKEFSFEKYHNTEDHDSLL